MLLMDVYARVYFLDALYRSLSMEHVARIWICYIVQHRLGRLGYHLDFLACCGWLIGLHCHDISKNWVGGQTSDPEFDCRPFMGDGFL